jgi:hypothetical protein
VILTENPPDPRSLKLDPEPSGADETRNTEQPANPKTKKLKADKEIARGDPLGPKSGNVTLDPANELSTACKMEKKVAETDMKLKELVVASSEREMKGRAKATLTSKFHNHVKGGKHTI